MPTPTPSPISRPDGRDRRGTRVTLGRRVRRRHRRDRDRARVRGRRHRRHRTHQPGARRPVDDHVVRVPLVLPGRRRRRVRRLRLIDRSDPSEPSVGEVAIHRMPARRIDALGDLVVIERDGEPLGDGRPGHGQCDVAGHRSALRDGRKQRAVTVGGGGQADGRGGRRQHLVGHRARPHRHDAEADAGKHEDVVDLGDRDLTVAGLDGRERAPGADQRSVVGPLEDVGRDGLAPRRRIRQRQHDRPIHVRGLRPDDRLGEQSGLTR